MVQKTIQSLFILKHWRFDGWWWMMMAVKNCMLQLKIHNFASFMVCLDVSLAFYFRFVLWVEACVLASNKNSRKQIYKHVKSYHHEWNTLTNQEDMPKNSLKVVISFSLFSLWLTKCMGMWCLKTILKVVSFKPRSTKLPPPVPRARPLILYCLVILKKRERYVVSC